jgi:hypothetical protein
MAQTEIDPQMSLALLAKNRPECKEQSSFGSALSSALVSALGVALQRCSYPPHECQECTMPFYPPFAKGTFLLCIDTFLQEIFCIWHNYDSLVSFTKGLE